LRAQLAGVSRYGNAEIIGHGSDRPLMPPDIGRAIAGGVWRAALDVDRAQPPKAPGDQPEADLIAGMQPHAFGADINIAAAVVPADEAKSPPGVVKLDRAK
jgi:hypothetical protein